MPTVRTLSISTALALALCACSVAEEARHSAQPQADAPPPVEVCPHGELAAELPEAAAAGEATGEHGQSGEPDHLAIDAPETPQEVHKTILPRAPAVEPEPDPTAAPLQLPNEPQPAAMTSEPNERARPPEDDEQNHGASRGPGVTFLPEPIQLGSMRFNVVDVGARPGAPSPDVIRYRIMVERGLEADAEVFAATVREVLGDPEGWSSAGLKLIPVNDNADINVLLAQPRTVDRLCLPLKTGGTLSCAMMGRANLNHWRWTHGAATWEGDLDGYRHYLINHEVGHLLGLAHAGCPKAGEPAPVMLPQTKYLGNCLPNGAPTANDTGRFKSTLKYWVARRDKRRAERARAAARAAAREKARNPSPAP